MMMNDEELNKEEGVRKGYPLTFFFFCDLSNNL